MKRAALTFLLVLALPVVAAEKWFEAYDRGVAAVNARNYKVAAEALQRSIAEMPQEGLGVRAKNSLITYLPHFWLGIAKFNLGDTDGALREWRISEEQGIVARTDYYARMKDWVARAELEKQRNARDAASGSKKSADAAISKALETQLDALSAGGDRADSYLAAQRKLQAARAQFQKAGTDVNAYRNAEQTALQAHALFSAAIEEGKKLRAARAATPPPAKKQPIAPPQRAIAQQPVAQPMTQPVAQQPAAIAASAIPIRATPPPAAAPQQTAPPVKATVEVRGSAATAPPAAPILSAAEVDRAIAQQEAKRKTLEGRQTSTEIDLRPAYRAYARGDLATAETLLSQIVARQLSPEALLLRGCTRYTKAMLARERRPLIAGATSDFQAALAMNGSLRLDRNAFSPKLVSFFETVRKQR